MITLYDFPLSGHAHRVRLMLSLLNLEYERVEVDLRTGEAEKTRIPRIESLWRGACIGGRRPGPPGVHSHPHLSRPPLRPCMAAHRSGGTGGGTDLARHRQQGHRDRPGRRPAGDRLRCQPGSRDAQLRIATHYWPPLTLTSPGRTGWRLINPPLPTSPRTPISPTHRKAMWI